MFFHARLELLCVRHRIRLRDLTETNAVSVSRLRNMRLLSDQEVSVLFAGAGMAGREGVVLSEFRSAEQESPRAKLIAQKLCSRCDDSINNLFRS